MRKIISVIMASMMLILANHPVFTAFAEEDISVILNGEKIAFYNLPYTDNDNIMVSAKEFFGYVGGFVEYKELQPSLKGYYTKVNETEILIPADSSVIYYDEVPIEFDVKTKETDGDIYFPISFLSYFYGAKYEQEGAKAKINIKIEKDKAPETEDRSAKIDRILANAVTPSVILDTSSLEKAELSNPSLIAKREPTAEDPEEFNKVFEFENYSLPVTSYASQFTAPSLDDIDEGDVLVWTFWARKIMSADESGKAFFSPCFEQNGGSWNKMHTGEKTGVSEDWSFFRYIFVANASYKAGGAHMAMRQGYKHQIMQFADMKMLNYKKTVNPADLIENYDNKPETYKGREDGALWREEAFKRIEKNRVRDISFSAEDESGNPIKDIDITAEMTRSEFFWGSAVSDYMISKRDTKNIYPRYVLPYFNGIVMESSMKEAVYNNGMGKRSGTFNTSFWQKFAQDNNLYFRGHAIMWDNTSNHSVYTDKWKTLPKEEYRERMVDHYKKRVSEFISAYGDNMIECDVINEAANNTFYREQFGIGFVADIFKYCRAVNPNMRLVYNDTGVAGLESQWAAGNKIISIAADLINEGAPIDSIGIQDHIPSGTFPYPQTFYNQMDAMAKVTGKAVVTEYDYESDLSDFDKAQSVEADMLRDHIIAVYSHPLLTGFVMWGPCDEGHWRANGPLIDRNGNEKPAAEYWKQYVLGEWKTNKSGKTDENGKLNIRGHRGEYKITAAYNGKTYESTLRVTENGENSVKIVADDGNLKIVSSEPVDIKKKSTPYYKDIRENRSVYQNAYFKAIEDSIVEVKTDSGRDMIFLKNSSNTSPWVSTDEALIIKTDDAYESGEIEISWHDKQRIYNYLIEISSDGKNFSPAVIGSGKEKTTDKIDSGRFNYIRIKPYGRLQLAIDSIRFMRTEK